MFGKIEYKMGGFSISGFGRLVCYMFRWGQLELYSFCGGFSPQHLQIIWMFMKPFLAEENSGAMHKECIRTTLGFKQDKQNHLLTMSFLFAALV